MGTRVYVGRVSHHARERDIERFFKGYGRIRDVMLKNGYCFVVRNFLSLIYANEEELKQVEGIKSRCIK
jgi:RNA recognition motif-containing protein